MKKWYKEINQNINKKKLPPSNEVMVVVFFSSFYFCLIPIIQLAWKK